ncbi:MAG: dihydrodipicolinate reductase [Proteobacteria bacterium]|nr:dihydrodipicolinate reductase [Pseudomonadota bacterium]
MQIIIAGTGKLAGELLSSLQLVQMDQVIAWTDRGEDDGPAIVVHAGSGRELTAIAAYCAARQSPLIELATGSQIEHMACSFPVILCPNTNILMLKFMSMLAKSGHLFRGYRIKLVESHQVQKTSVPGTAVSMAHALGLQATEIQSIRDVDVQRSELHIPEENLARHAYHQIFIEDGACSLKFETRVQGDTPYADGVAKIIAAVHGRALENRLYAVTEFIDKGWL